jgi:hypothetical protein
MRLCEAACVVITGSVNSFRKYFSGDDVFFMLKTGFLRDNNSFAAMRVIY